MKLYFLALALVFLVSGACAFTIEYIPALYIEDYGAGTDYAIQNVTIKSDTSFVNGSFVVLGTNDQHSFTLLDTRQSLDFSAGTPREFAFDNVVQFRQYFLYLTKGFPVGANIDVYFNDTFSSASNEQITTPFNFTMGRSPVVKVFDFTKNPIGATVGNYSIMTNQSFLVGAEWYLFGTNTFSLGDIGASLTELDHQSAITFTAGTWEDYDLHTKPVYDYYILYVKNGFYSIGTEVNIKFTSAPGAPPVVNPTANFNGTPLTGDVPLGVYFVDMSDCYTCTGYSWDFNEDSVEDSSARNYTYTYNTAGVYTVSLTVTNATGSDTETKIDYITVKAVEIPLGEGYSDNSVINLTEYCGSTWCRWSWNQSITNSTNLYLNGNLTATNYTLGFYYLQDVNPGEEHIFELRILNQTHFNETAKYKSSGNLRENEWLWLIIGLILMGVGIWIPYADYPAVFFFFAGGTQSFLQSSTPEVLTIYWFMFGISIIVIAYKRR